MVKSYVISLFNPTFVPIFNQHCCLLLKQVITCEGNAGFYEVGLITTPFKAGYSVLGWNHPGFGGSSGLPSPESEKNAIEVVMQYAIEELGFPVNKIFIYAWSIGEC
ncbi:PREDICTED: protein ABHD16A-like [Acropora digitifera]|uniref:protein ABHD16A-like n=1 Tax=Acropora digitifera TaxID=70779 RepID=UPI00077B111E|nr:PREDICTED: protein ABHD16A-like [Acropora digitifera]